KPISIAAERHIRVGRRIMGQVERFADRGGVNARLDVRKGQESVGQDPRAQFECRFAGVVAESHGAGPVAVNRERVFADPGRVEGALLLGGRGVLIADEAGTFEVSRLPVNIGPEPHRTAGAVVPYGGISTGEQQGSSVRGYVAKP